MRIKTSARTTSRIWWIDVGLYFINTKLSVNLRLGVQALAKHVKEDEGVEDIHPDFCEKLHANNIG